MSICIFTLLLFVMVLRSAVGVVIYICIVCVVGVGRDVVYVVGCVRFYDDGVVCVFAVSSVAD